ncbi:transglycosylase SLT domain-containing protein [Nanoarchaeota archaeon]
MVKKILFGLGIVFLVVALIVIAPFNDVESQYCQGADYNALENNKDSKYANCYRFLDSFVEFSGEDSEIDPLLMMAIAAQEGGFCSDAYLHSDIGIMQAESCRGGRCPTADRQIEEGINTFRQKASIFRNLNVDEDIPIMDLILFSYNRGEAVAKNALKILKERDDIADLGQALIEACKEYYNVDGLGCERCSKDSHGNDKCNPDKLDDGSLRAYSVGYPLAIYDKHAEICSDAGGKIDSTTLIGVDLDYIYSDPTKIYGTYTFNPNFRTSFDYDFIDYELLWEYSTTAMNDCVDKETDVEFEECIKIIFEVEPFVMEECETAEQKEFRQFVEKFLSCKDAEFPSGANSCRCKNVFGNIDLTEEFVVEIKPQTASYAGSEEQTNFLFSDGDNQFVVDDEIRVVHNIDQDFDTHSITPTTPIKFEGYLRLPGFQSRMVRGQTTFHNPHLQLIKTNKWLGIFLKSNDDRAQIDLYENLPKCEEKKGIYPMCIRNTKTDILYKFALDFSNGEATRVSLPTDYAPPTTSTTALCRNIPSDLEIPELTEAEVRDLSAEKVWEYRWEIPKARGMMRTSSLPCVDLLTKMIGTRPGLVGTKEDANASISAVQGEVETAAQAHDVPKALINTVITIESRGKYNAVSTTGAMGIMQLISDHYYPKKSNPAAYGGVNIAPFDTALNIDRGANLLKNIVSESKTRNNAVEDVDVMLFIYSRGGRAFSDVKDLFWGKGNGPEPRVHWKEFVGSEEKLEPYAEQLDEPIEYYLEGGNYINVVKDICKQDSSSPYSYLNDEFYQISDTDPGWFITWYNEHCV